MPRPQPSSPRRRPARSAKCAATGGTRRRGAASAAEAANALLVGLNHEQFRAVTAGSSPLLVLAGAGSGKTRVITVRIAWLLAHGAAPASVLALTFTNKAAAEMRERLAGLVGREQAAQVVAGTFHSFCLALLREFGEHVGLGGRFVIADAGDQQSALRSVLRDLRVPETTLHPSALQSRISLLKNRLQTPEGLLASADGPREELVGRAWRAYDSHLRRTRSVDFDDILLFTLRLLREQSEVLALLQERHAHVLVDEYQDTNAPQYEIVARLAAGHRRLCVVGDDDQSIYGWRGADVTRILSFGRDFPDATVVRLETNYRSTTQILSAANRVIRHNPERHAKTLHSAVGDGPEPRVLQYDDELAEADGIARQIAELHVQGARWNEFAILFRTAQQARPLESALRAAQIPYVLVGGPSFFDRREVRDVLAYLRLLVHPEDEVSLLRIANTPARGLGKSSLDRLLEAATSRGLPVGRIFDEAASVPGVPAAAVTAARELRALLVDLAARARVPLTAPAVAASASASASASEAEAEGKDDAAPAARRPRGRDLVGFVREVLDGIGYRAEIDRLYPEPREREQRWQSVLEMLDLAENYARSAARVSLPGFLDRLALACSDERDDEAAGAREQVTLMTLHASKGLEFPRVYLVGCEEGLLPHQRSLDEDTLPEERRLMYVGITRARDRLQLSYAASRSRQGARHTGMPSRFLFELAEREPPPQWRPAAPTDTGSKGRRGARSGARGARGGRSASRPA